MPELSDLPVEILGIIAEKCEFRARFNLRSTSTSMKEVVDQSKFVLEDVSLKMQNSRSLRILFDNMSRDGNRTRHTIFMRIENADSMEKTAKWIANIFKNAEIQYLKITPDNNGVAENLLKDLIKRVKDNSNSKSPLKARGIRWRTTLDPFLICDKSYCRELLTCYHDDPNFFQEYKDSLINMDDVLLRETMNITDEDVLSMKARFIQLTSENFSAEMIIQLAAKFEARGLITSGFCLENPKGGFISDIKIPDGFSNPRKIKGWHVKIVEKKIMELTVKDKTVWFEIYNR